MDKETKTKWTGINQFVWEKKNKMRKKNPWQFHRIASMCLVTLHVCLPSEWSSALTLTFYSILFTSLLLMKHTFDIMQSPKPIQKQMCGRANRMHETTKETNETCTNIIIIIIIEWYLNAAVCVLLHSLHCIANSNGIEPNWTVSWEKIHVCNSVALIELSFLFAHKIKSKQFTKQMLQLNLQRQTAPQNRIAHLVNGKQHNHAKCDDMNWNS